MKRLGRAVLALNVLVYNLYRYVRYSGLRGSNEDLWIRNYHLVKIYHALEKSMSYRERDSSRGWKTAFLLLDELEKSQRYDDRGCHDSIAIHTLNNFLEHGDNKNRKESEIIRNRLNEIQTSVCTNSSDTSITRHRRKDFERGMLESPEDFFLSRYTLREFKDDVVDERIVQRAVNMALKAPSVCNRQPWHIYYTTDGEVIKEALSHQAGNVGFGHKVRNLMIVCTDLKAFMAGNEAYQYWIDGGLISMSLVYAFHSLGVASCCLNWSQHPRNDLALRKKLNISDHHTIIMMLAYGWPDEENTVCESRRRPSSSFITKLDRR